MHALCTSTNIGQLRSLRLSNSLQVSREVFGARLMAGMALTAALTSRFSILGLSIAQRTRWGSRVLVTSASRPPQGNLGGDAMKPMSEEIGGEMNTSAEDTRGMASAAVAHKPDYVTYENTEDDAVKSVVDSAARGASKAADNVKGMADATASQVAETTRNIGDKAKQVAEDAWDSAKETVEKVKETVMGKAEDAKECIKDNAESVKRAMNTKNRR